ncbi:hypothetical protein J2776_002930 [Paraburkholderia caledonica]|uniref:Uncharacterized protein n=1 Tax=Paraburkholderia caledonica TaxID=134536 RepID=A0ABU1KZ52_9BURK|nr:hypothetical protein [Paraburkholderia caledonica]
MHEHYGGMDTILVFGDQPSKGNLTIHNDSDCSYK